MNEKMKIAKIISTKQVVINAGSDAGLKPGDKLEIIDKFGTDPVKDPDTGESLGTLDLPKGELIVSKVYPKMAIADSPKKPSIAYVPGGIPGFPTIQRDLNVDPKQITGGFPKSSGEQIKVGDIVIKRS
ncbi:hypothetical protein HF82_01065 [Limosilactobacillus reuteri]|nr:FlgT C-terminal domain-containing protein [Limosilactobacillus reuteri]KEQ20537.1 hypothetical protein HF82_01065 [Limosilactobacillus reuteri]